MSGASGSCNTSMEWLKTTESDENESDKESIDYVRVHSPSPIGGLPLELWWSILEIAEDPRALLAIGCTCKTLCAIVAGIVSKRRNMGIHDLAADPTRGYFLYTAKLESTELQSWITRYDTKSLHLWALQITGPGLLLRSQTKSALSLLQSVTYLTLSDTHFLSFSEFARAICALPNLTRLNLRSVTVGDSRSYNLKSVYFARTLRLNVLDIWNCTFGESHPVWNLVTAPLLSDSLEHIWVLSAADDPERALKQLALPPALLLSAYLGHLQELRVALWRLSCERERDVALSHLLSRLPADRIANIEIVYRCPHRSPHLDRWKLLFSVLDDVIATTHFSSLTTITMALHTLYSLDVDYTRAAVDSLPFSRIWAETFTMSSISLTSPGADETCSVNRRVSERAEALAEAHTERITLTLELGLPLRPEHKTTVLYVRRPSL